MTGGPDLASAPLARAVMARWSWRAAGLQRTQRLLGGLAGRRWPMLQGAWSLQAWHDALAHRWRPFDIVPPARTAGVVAAPVLAGGVASPAPVDGAAKARGSPERGGVPMPKASGRGHAAPARIDPASGAASMAQRLPAPALAPARPALTITTLAAPAAISAAPLPVPFRSSTPATSAAADPPPGGPVLVPAIGRRFARREMVGGLSAAPARGLATTEAVPAPPPTVPVVRWRVVDGKPADDAQRRAGAMLRASDGDEDLQAPPAPLALRAEPRLPAHRTDPTADRRRPGADLVERLGASEAIPLGLSVRLVPPEEAARRLALDDDANGRRDEAQSARSEAGGRREFPRASARPPIDIDAIVERVQRELKRREQFERERKGLF